MALKEKKKKKKDKEVVAFKSKCCGKYKKHEDKRCSRCPMFDLIKNLK